MHRRLLTVTSVLSAILLTVHVADDIVRGIEPGRLANLGTLPICVVWLYCALLAPGRRLGQAILFVGGLLGVAVPYLHMSGRGVGVDSRHAGTDGQLFFVWTLLAIGVTGLFSLVMLAHELWRPKAVEPRRDAAS